jgi:IS1 family transposase
MIVLKQTSFGRMWGKGEKEEQRVACLRVSPGKRDLKTAKKLRERLKRLGISYDRVAADNWERFVSAFGEDNHEAGKEHTAGIEGNNCRLRHRIRRVFRRTCCFSKKLRNHWKAFAMTFFFYINYGFV